MKHFGQPGILTIVVLFIFINIVSFVEQKKIRKIPVHLPRQPLVNQRPWLMAGLLLALSILLMIIYNYIIYAKDP